MLRKPDERRIAEGSDCRRPGGPPAGLGCRAVQVGLAIYLTPVFLVVILIGGTAVISGSLARIAGRMIHHGDLRPRHGPVLKGLKTAKETHSPRLAARPGRGRVI